MFNYADDGINWSGRAGGGLGAVAGYNVGDENRHFELPGSFSEDVQYIDNTTGNTGKEGQWVLVLDGEFHSHIIILCNVISVVHACTYMHMNSCQTDILNLYYLVLLDPLTDTVLVTPQSMLFSLIMHAALTFCLTSCMILKLKTYCRRIM